MPSVSISFDSTFNVHDSITSALIGEISLTCEGWAAYTIIPATGRIKTRRIGTFKEAAIAIRAIDEAKPSLTTLLALMR